MSPSTFRFSFVIPAIACSEPLGLPSSVTSPPELT